MRGMGWRACDAYERDAEARRRALPWRERYNWTGLALFASALALTLLVCAITLSESASSQEFKYDPNAATKSAVREKYCREVVIVEFFKCADSAIFIGLQSAKIRDKGQLSMFAINYCKTYIGLLYQCPPDESREAKAQRITAFIDSKVDDTIRIGQPRTNAVPLPRSRPKAEEGQ
jgi:hypothetical protein